MNDSEEVGNTIMEIWGKKTNRLIIIIGNGNVAKIQPDSTQQQILAWFEHTML